ncbi:MAG: hypothetical protein GF417_12125 [Candidatus Latescibacteria bacterium]|nr:hypothetical protein [Candidatus Latescibacterota bacterium]
MEWRLFEQLKKDWSIIRENPPGSRFQARFRYRQSDPSGSALKRVVKTAAGIFLIPLGILLWFIPGPGWLVIFIGLALLAARSRWLSLLLDRAELAVRKMIPGGR